MCDYFSGPFFLTFPYACPCPPVLFFFSLSVHLLSLFLPPAHAPPSFPFSLPFPSFPYSFLLPLSTCPFLSLFPSPPFPLLPLAHIPCPFLSLHPIVSLFLLVYPCSTALFLSKSSSPPFPSKSSSPPFPSSSCDLVFLCSFFPLPFSLSSFCVLVYLPNPTAMSCPIPLSLISSLYHVPVFPSLRYRSKWQY